MKKIMFNDKYGLTAAVLSGAKTQTRRIISDKLILKFGHNQYNDKSFDLFTKAPIMICERVAIAQAYSTNDFCKHICTLHNCKENSAKQGAMIGLYMSEAGWENKMFVKAELMPHVIEITDWKIERLQDISESDCFAEGIMQGDFMNTRDKYYFDLVGDCVAHITFPTAQKAYASLINRICGKGTWERNPYVYAYTFNLLQ